MVFGEDNGIVFFGFEDDDDFLKTFKSTLVERRLDSSVIFFGIGVLRNLEIGLFNVKSEEYCGDSVSLPNELMALSRRLWFKEREISLYTFAQFYQDLSLVRSADDFSGSLYAKQLRSLS